MIKSKLQIKYSDNSGKLINSISKIYKFILGIYLASNNKCKNTYETQKNDDEELLKNTDFSNIRVKTIMNNFNTEEHSLNQKINQNIFPFKYNFEENRLYDVLIPLVTCYNKNNGLPFLIYLNFKSNEKQIYWNAVGAVAFMKKNDYY